MANLEEERRFVIQIIDNLKGNDEDNISALENYLLNNKFKLEDLNNQDFDIICYALDSRASSSLLKFIIKHCSYETYNYTFYITDNYLNYCTKYRSMYYAHIEYVVPLFIAINNEHWEVAELLLKERKADINYLSTRDENIISYIYLNYNDITDEKLNFILKKGFYAIGFPKNLIDFLLLNDSNNNYLKTIFKRYYLDNDFILRMINISKRNKVITDDALNQLFEEEKSKIKIDDNSYYCAIKSENYEALIFLLNYDSDPREVVINRIHRFNLWQYIYKMNKYRHQLDLITSLVRQILYSFNRMDLEELFDRANHNESIEFILKLYINKLYRSKYVDIYSSKFENMLLASSKVNNLVLMYFNLSSIMSESKDTLIREKIQYKNTGIERLKRRIAKATNPNVKKALEKELKELIELEDPLSVKQFKHQDSPFLSLLINIAIKIHFFDEVYFLLKNEEIKGKIDLNCPDRNGEYPFQTILTYTKNDNSALNLFQYMLEFIENHQNENQNQTQIQNNNNNQDQSQILYLLTVALTTNKYMAIKFLLKRNDIWQWLKKKSEEENDDNDKGEDVNKKDLEPTTIDSEFKVIYQRYRQKISQIQNQEQNQKRDKEQQGQEQEKLEQKQEILNENGNQKEIISSQLNNNNNMSHDYTNHNNNNNNNKNDNNNNNNNSNKKKNSSSGGGGSGSSNQKKKRRKKNNKKRKNNKKDEILKCYPFNNLTLAYLLGEKENLKLLIEKGNSVNELDDYGYSILHFMILKNDIEMIQFLIDHTDIRVNSYLNEFSRGHSALDIIFNCCDTKDMLKTLLKCPSFDINQPESGEEIPLMMILKNQRLNNNEKFDSVQLILEKGSDVDIISNEGRSALGYAIQTDHLPLVQLLCKFGADVNFTDSNKISPLNYAIEKKSESIVAYLVEQGANVNFIDIYDRSPLIYAIESEYFPVVKILVDHGADMDIEVEMESRRKRKKFKKECLFLFAIDNFELSTIQYLLEHGIKYDFKSSDSLCHLLPEVFYGFRDELFEFLINHQYIDVKDLTVRSLNDLIFRNHIKHLKLLMEKEDFNVDMTDEEGHTLLSKSVFYQKEEMIKFLLEEGASVQPINEHIDLLAFFFFNDDDDDFDDYEERGGRERRERKRKEKIQKKLMILKTLVDHGLDVNATDMNGENLLIYALQHQKIQEFIPQLLEWGADPNYVNHKKNPPLSIENYNEKYNFRYHIQQYRLAKSIIKPYLHQ